MAHKILIAVLVIATLYNTLQTSETITIARQTSQNVAQTHSQVEVIQSQLEDTKDTVDVISGRMAMIEDMVFGKVMYNDLTENQKTNAVIAWEAAERHEVDPEFLTYLAFCESSLDDKAVNTNSDKRKTTDYGLFQINNYWHAEVAKECATDPECAADWAAKRIAKGYAHEWYCSAKITYEPTITKNNS